jgi:hypothetical protein
MTTDADAAVDEAPLSMGEVDIDALLGAAVDVALRNEAGVKIECAGIGDDDAVVIGDRARLERAFERLLSVAIRSCQRGATITVALVRRPHAWSIRVRHPVRVDLDADVSADCRLRLALIGAVLHAHRGSWSTAVDGSERTLVVMLPERSVAKIV